MSWFELIKKALIDAGFAVTQEEVLVVDDVNDDVEPMDQEWDKDEYYRQASLTVNGGTFVLFLGERSRDTVYVLGPDRAAVAKVVNEADYEE